MRTPYSANSQKGELAHAISEGRTRLEELENTILRQLSWSKGSLLEDQGLVDALHASKATSESIARTVGIAEDNEAR